MRPLSAAAAAVGVCLALAGCSPPTQDKTGQDIKAVGSEIGAAAKDVASTPAVKQLGSDIKQGAHEAAAKTKVAADQAGEELKASAVQAGHDIKSGAKTAGDKTDAALNKANADVKK